MDDCTMGRMRAFNQSRYALDETGYILRRLEELTGRRWGPVRSTTPRPVRDEVWTSGDGRKMFVCDIEEEHLRNIVRQMVRARRLSAAMLQEEQMEAIKNREQEQQKKEVELYKQQYEALTVR